uniref:Uncharacterized protein n=1 Tax=Sphaerodactylus townsendi TaxID=933632 RepID=A0ACB8ELV6_9SAUR
MQMRAGRKDPDPWGLINQESIVRTMNSHSSQWVSCGEIRLKDVSRVNELEERGAIWIFPCLSSLLGHRRLETKSRSHSSVEGARFRALGPNSPEVRLSSGHSASKRRGSSHA